MFSQMIHVRDTNQQDHYVNLRDISHVYQQGDEWRVNVGGDVVLLDEQEVSKLVCCFDMVAFEEDVDVAEPRPQSNFR